MLSTIRTTFAIPSGVSAYINSAE